MPPTQAGDEESRGRVEGLCRESGAQSQAQLSPLGPLLSSLALSLGC